MKFATVGNQRAEATPGTKGLCDHCDSELIAKCGEIRIKHWAHKGNHHCDRWWEPETVWHRNWKDRFPVEWQEFRHQASDGEWHIADVKTNGGWALEFQHSHLKPEERRARNAFYQKLAWVVDGLRLKKDQKRFLEALRLVKPVNTALVQDVFMVNADNSALFRDWAGSSSPVFFDFGQEEMLWCLLPGVSYVVKFLRAGFIGLHQQGTTQTDLFGDFLKNLCAAITGKHIAPSSSDAAPALPQTPRRPQTYYEYLVQRHRARSHRRF